MKALSLFAYPALAAEITDDPKGVYDLMGALLNRVEAHDVMTAVLVLMAFIITLLGLRIFAKYIAAYNNQTQAIVVHTETLRNFGGAIAELRADLEQCGIDQKAAITAVKDLIVTHLLEKKERGRE